MDTVEKKLSPSGLIIDLMIWVLPTALLSVLWLLVTGLVPKVYSVLLFCVCPGILISRIIFIIRSKRSVGNKIWRIAIWASMPLVIFFVSMFTPEAVHHSSKTNALNKYETAISGKFPGDYVSPADLGLPVSSEYHYHHGWAVVYDSYALILLNQYSEADYASEVNNLNELYGPVSEPFYTIGDDVFTLITPESRNIPFFKRCTMIVTNDVTHEIGLIEFSDIDLDVADDRERFINSYFGWEYVR